jgi:Zn-dependent membrane protease YugP
MIFYGFDSYYFLLVLPAVFFALWAQMKVSSTYSKYSRVRSATGMTGADAAKAVLEKNGVRGVRIERTPGTLSDHYAPRDNTIYLSEGVHDAQSVAALGIAAHEAGHAVQHEQEYTPMRVRAAIVPVTRIGSFLAWPLIIIGLIIESVYAEPLFWAGLILFSTVFFFQLVTLPVEFNASARAMNALGTFLGGEEKKGARRMLTAAALTYVAATVVALAQLLRVLLLFSGRKRR